ncbi:MAG TPA: beta-propeller fold lactonase family protein [Kofleriaceae bacterium]|nr:beta-propeller fold lactonase family protein [Kofleriaceae bacterium]
MLASLVLAGCVTDGKDGAPGSQGPAGANGSDGTNGADGATGAQGPAGPQLALPAVYTLSNAAAGNQIAAYTRATNGTLSRMGRFATGGAGLGSALGSQGALAWDARTQRFFAVNTGDDTISMLALAADGSVTTLATVGSGGKRPVSITVYGNAVYVANQGDLGSATVGANISGFSIEGNDLVAIAGSTQPLSAATDVHPTDIHFTPDGKFLVVAERLANKLDTFAVQNGVAQPGNFQVSAGAQPFAFDFSPEGFLIVAEVGDGTATGSSASSYSIDATGTLTAITSALATNQGAACWIVAAGGFAYISNAATANLTGLVVSESGALTLHDASGVTATTAAGSIDLAVAPDNGYLYALAGAPHRIFPFALASDGSLTAIPVLLDVPAASAGLVAR